MWVAVEWGFTFVDIQPVFAFAVFRRMPDFTASGALLLGKSRTSDFLAKLGSAFRVMRLTFFEWEAALITKLTERASHLC